MTKCLHVLILLNMYVAAAATAVTLNYSVYMKNYRLPHLPLGALPHQTTLAVSVSDIVLDIQLLMGQK